MEDKECTFLIEKIKDADMVLVGIGEEWEGAELLLKKEAAYVKACGEIEAADVKWVMPYVNYLFLKDEEKLKTALDTLAKLLKDKNYFIVSVCMNGLLGRSALREDRIAEPCGSYTKMQCHNGCSGSVQPVTDGFLKEVEVCLGGEKPWTSLKQPMCFCGEKMEFNSLYAEHYLEEGYRDNWSIYMKWLQGTLNKKLCVLELGAGMMFPGVLRFRFEKIVGLNKKASFIRIHKNLYQIPQEIAERSIGISENSVDYMAKIDELC